MKNKWKKVKVFLPVINWKEVKPWITVAFTSILIYIGIVYIGNITNVQVEIQTPVAHSPSPRKIYHNRYGTYRLEKNKSMYYWREVGKDLYFYPATPGTCIILKFQKLKDPSCWSYRVYRRADGSIGEGDDKIFDRHDSGLNGWHSVTLISQEDADVVFSDRPIEK